MLGEEIEIVENLNVHEEPNWETIPEEDIQRNDKENLLDHCPSIEVILKHKLLKENVKIVVPPDCHQDQLVEVLDKIGKKGLPVIIYAVSEDTLSDFVSLSSLWKRMFMNLNIPIPLQNIQEIRKLKDLFLAPFLFVSVNTIELPVLNTESLTESEKHSLENNGKESVKHLHSLKEQLVRLGR